MDTSPTTLTRQVWTAPPSEALRPYVRAFVAQAIDIPPGETATLTIAATVYPVLMVTYAGTVWSEKHLGDAAPIPDIALTGPIPVAFQSTFRGAPRGFFVHLEPAGPLALLGVDAAAYQGVSVPLAARPDTWPLVEAWGRDIAAAGDGDGAFEARVARTERLGTDLLALPGLARSRERATAAARMAEHVIGTDGRRRVREMAADLGVGESTLRRRFRTDLGITPKPFSAVVRFRHALAYLHTHPGASWAGVASGFGYADQSHLIRDYKRFAGVVPSRWDDAERFIDLTFGILQEGAPDDEHEG